MPALKLSIITSMILFTLLSFLPTRTVGTFDGDRSDINAALLRQMHLAEPRSTIRVSIEKFMACSALLLLQHRE
ncbi:hypothetical protein ACWX0K_07220 [Nitrobacteraceae bacterium UC4446_H13]